MTPETVMLAKRFETPFGERLNYRLYSPDLEPNASYPLILFLHGAGERGEDNTAQLAYGVADILSYIRANEPAFLLAPQCPSEMRWANIRGRLTRQPSLPEFPSQSLKLTLELLETFIENNPVNPDRSYLTGLSMGGFGTWDLLMRRPNLFAAAIPICGGGDAAKAALIRHIPQWIFHGSADPIIAPEHSRRMVKALKKAGSKPKYTEYEGVDHNSWDRTYANARVLRWLFAQRKSDDGMARGLQ